MPAPTDPLYPQQYHLDQIGNIEAIWAEYTGRGVSVGIFDDGVQYDHPDLARNYDSSLHFRDGGVVYDAYPIDASDGHGTAVAGLIGAVANNGIGGTGVAPGVSLTGVNFLEDIQDLTPELNYTSLRWAANFDIMNNSWGQTPVYADYQSLLSGSGAATIAAYQDVVDAGRGGLGTIIVQSSGNDAMNANGSALNASRFTATIAAADASGNPASYSNFGANTLITAPGTTFTTDLTGSGGYSSGDYAGFTGTSAAAPVVSGVVALMLEANDGLGWRDVQQILAMSASQTGSAFGTGAAGREVGAWFENGADNWNGGGMTFHYNYGFGMLDAYTAVRFAEVWSLMHNAAHTSRNEVSVTAANNSARSLPDLSTTNVGVKVDQNIRIENIEVTLDITHSYAEDLTIFLVAPDGTRFTLMSEEGGATLMDGGFQWRFGVTGALGMTSEGNWQLQIVDGVRGATGTLHGVSLDFFGSTVRNHQVHHFTDDVRTFIADGRTTINVESRMDWLNLSAIADGVYVDLDGGSDWFINFDGIPRTGGTNTMTLTDTVRRVVLGDGDDTIEGSDAGGVIYGGRGDDRINGGVRNDVIHGQDGDDTIFGDRGRDTIRGGDGDDVLKGAGGWDRLIGGGGRDTINGGGGNDVLRGETGADWLIGGAGDDVIHGNAGRDVLFGNSGNDSLYGGGGHDRLLGDIGRDLLRGGSGRDTLIGNGGNDRLLGDAGQDLLRGGNGRDQLFGGGGNDTLFGNAGDDVLLGGRGNDRLTGGRGSDNFVFNRREGNDTITDFAANEDVLQLRLSLVGTVRTGDSVVSRFGRTEGDDFLLDFGTAGTTIRLAGLAGIDTDLLAGQIEFI